MAKKIIKFIIYDILCGVIYLVVMWLFDLIFGSDEPSNPVKQFIEGLVFYPLFLLLNWLLDKYIK
jgi:hypothetical protein